MKVLLFALAAGAAAQFLQLPPLNYAYGALEPFISEDIMRVHSLGHHAAYTAKANEAMATLRANDSTKALAKKGIDWLIAHLNEVPPQLRPVLRNHGGGYVNHELFFRILAAPSVAVNGSRALGVGGAINVDAPLAKAIEAQFGSIDAFKTQFKAAAMGVFGSGWAWLEYRTRDSALAISTTADQDTPAMEPGRIPIIGLDVWEHAYYLSYKNMRGNYVDAFWNVLDFNEADRIYQRAVESAGAGAAGAHAEL